MGFLGSIGSFLGGAVNTVVKTVTSPAKLTTAVLTGGASVVAPKTFAPLTSAVGSTLYNPQLLTGVARKAALPAIPAFSAGLPTIGGTMGLDLGNLLGGAISGIGSLIGGSSPSTALGQFTSFLPQTVGFKPPQPTTPGTAGAMRLIPMVGRRFYEKFPNLASAIQSLRNRGANITRGKLWSLLKRFGPDILISGGILTAAAVSELMMAGPGTRRMNPGNVKALRRSMRRLESFHKLCMTADRLRRPRARSCKSSRGSAQQFVRQG